MTRRCLSRPAAAPTLAALPLLTLLAACGGPTSTLTPAPSSTSAAPTGAPSVSSSATPTATPTPTPTPEARTDDDLRQALLKAGDLPDGFEKRAALTPAESGLSVKGKGSSCKRLAKLLQAESSSGSLATASASFGRGDDGPGVDESLDAMANAAAAEAVIDDFVAAASKCSTLTFELRSSGSSTIKVSVLDASKLGDGSSTVRLVADGGAVDGLSLKWIAAHSEDIVLGMVFADLPDDDAEQIAEDAMATLRKRLDRG